MRPGLLLLVGAGLAGWHLGRQSAALRPYLPAPTGAVVPASTLAARAKSTLENSRGTAESSRRQLAVGDVELALQLHSGAWWMLGAAAMLATYARDPALDEAIRAQAALLNADGRRFEELAARGNTVARG